MKLRSFAMLAVLGLGAGLIGGSARASKAGEIQLYILLGNGINLPLGFERVVERADDIVTSTIPEIGIAVVESSNPDFVSEAASIRGLQSVPPIMILQWIDPVETIAAGEFGNPSISGDGDFFFDLQRGYDASNAPET